ncbi:class I SAM-dependent methyltransferase [Chloroflexota bacterium]
MNEGIFDIKQANKLDNPERIRELRPQELLRNIAKIHSGNTCIDFGSGTGTFTLTMAELVGSKGKVYAIDNSPEMLGHIKAKHPPNNLKLIHADVKRTSLDSQIANICLLAFILHEVQEPKILVAEAFRLLRANGSLVVVEWKSDLDSPGPPRKARIPQEQITRLFSQVGLSSIQYIDWSKNHYAVVGNKKVAAVGFEPTTKGL